MPDSAAKPSWINSTVLGVGLASLCSDVGHEMATTAMPALLASIGASSAVLGLIEGLADGFSSFAKLISGLYSDRMERRKPLAVVGYFVTASGMASFALATSWWHVLIGRVGGWVGRGARTPVRNVLLTEATTPRTYGRAFGLERAMDSAGAVIGPILAVVATSVLGLRWTFALTLIPGLLAAAVLAGGYALAVIPAAALLFPGASLAKFAVVFGVSGLYMGVWETVESSTAATLLPQESRGLGFGVLATVNGLGDLISSAVAGALWVLHPSAAMGFVIATSTAGAAVIALTPAPAIA